MIVCMSVCGVVVFVIFLSDDEELSGAANKMGDRGVDAEHDGVSPHHGKNRNRMMIIVVLSRDSTTQNAINQKIRVYWFR